MGLSKTKQARVLWLTKLGLVVEKDFTIDEKEGILIHCLEEFYPWNAMGKKSQRKEIEDFLKVFAGEVGASDEDQKGASDKAVVVKSLSEHYPELAKLPSLKKTLGKVAAGAKAECAEQQRHEDQVEEAEAALADLPTLADTLPPLATLEELEERGIVDREDQAEAAQFSMADLPGLAKAIKVVEEARMTEDPVIEAVVEKAKDKLAETVKDVTDLEEAKVAVSTGEAVELRAEPALEEPLFKVGTRRGSGTPWVWLSPRFRKAIAAEVAELFEGIADSGGYALGDVAAHIERKCLKTWGYASKNRQAAAKAAFRYAKIVEKSLIKQQGELKVNQYWANA
jgi:hypothetical protein